MGEAGEPERGHLVRAAFPLERYRFQEHPRAQTTARLREYFPGAQTRPH
jgi:hypothetical protein